MHTAAQLTKAAWQLVAVYGGGTGRLTEGFLSSSSSALVAREATEDASQGLP